jgi:sugar O-acyltransferase (sialic acid O-acetyltransferase NeuD family)
MPDFYIVGARSPLVVDYEETAARLGQDLTGIVQIDGAPRVLNRALLTSIDDIAAPGTFCACAFGPERRRAHAATAKAAGLTAAPALIDPTAAVAGSARIGDGSFVNALVAISGLVMIGGNVLVNRSSSIGHHSMIGDLASIGPGVTMAGNVRVGAGAVIGAGSTVLPDVKIGASAIVAAGSVVRRDVAEGAFVAGNPAVVKEFDGRSRVFDAVDQE